MMKGTFRWVLILAMIGWSLFWGTNLVQTIGLCQERAASMGALANNFMGGCFTGAMMANLLIWGIPMVVGVLLLILMRPRTVVQAAPDLPVRGTTPKPNDWSDVTRPPRV